MVIGREGRGVKLSDVCLGDGQGGSEWVANGSTSSRRAL